MSSCEASLQEDRHPLRVIGALEESWLMLM